MRGERGGRSEGFPRAGADCLGRGAARSHVALAAASRRAECRSETLVRSDSPGASALVHESRPARPCATPSGHWELLVSKECSVVALEIGLCLKTKDFPRGLGLSLKTQAKHVDPVWSRSRTGKSLCLALVSNPKDVSIPLVLIMPWSRLVQSTTGLLRSAAPPRPTFPHTMGAALTPRLPCGICIKVMPAKDHGR